MFHFSFRKLHHDKRLEENLKEIYDLEVALEEEHESKRQLLMFLLGAFKDYCFCKCPIFVKYFRHFFFTGSYFEGLRVKEATEFDINVAFDFPFCQDDYMVNMFWRFEWIFIIVNVISKCI